MLVAKGELDRAVLVKLAPVEAEVLLQRLCDELPLVERRLCFSRHCGRICGGRSGIFGRVDLGRAGIEGLFLAVVLVVLVVRRGRFLPRKTAKFQPVLPRRHDAGGESPGATNPGHCHRLKPAPLRFSNPSPSTTIHHTTFPSRILSTKVPPTRTRALSQHNDYRPQTYL